MKFKAIETLRFIGVPIEDPSVPTEAKKEKAVKISLGGWNSVTDNGEYYPDVKSANDVIPKPEDFLLVPFRLISATMVGKETWRATRFPEDVLKASMPLLERRPVYTDHDTSTVTNCIGHVESVYWQEAYTDANGLVIPAGINGNFAINCKIAPHVAANLYTGAIDSNSVTVEFYWEASHKNLSPDDNFNYKIGEYDENGQQYCRIVTEILKYPETSPVTRGADPYARALGKDGKVIAPDTAMLSMSANERVKSLNKESRSIICTNEIETLRLSDADKGYQQSNSAENTEKKVKMKKELVLLTATLLGLSADITELTDEQQDLLIAKITELSASKEEKPNVEREALTSLLTRSELSVGEDIAPYRLAKAEELTALHASVTSLKGELQAAKTENERLRPLAATGETVIVSLRSEAERLHSAAMRGKPSEAMLTLIKTADKPTLEGLVQSFGGQLTSGEFAATCTVCGTGEHVSFQSSVPDKGQGGGSDVIIDTRSVQERVAEAQANRDVQL